MTKHFFLAFVIGLAVQASSIAAVRAEYSGSVSGETAREVSGDVDADNGSIASEDMSSNATASPTVINTNTNNINVETGSQAKAASNSDANAEVDNRDQRRTRRTEIAYGGHSEAEVEYSEHSHRSQPRVAIIPMLGGGFWSGPWKMNITNDFNFGLALDFPVTSLFSIEAEGSYASYQIGYTNAASGNPITLDPGTARVHRFDQFLAGTNGKLYFWRGAFRMYGGAGMDMIYYRGMNYGPYAPNGLANVSYDQIIGAGQVFLGAELAVSESISLGVRTTWVKPLINRPTTVSNGIFAAPGCEEAAAIDTSFYRALGTVKVSF